MPDNKPQGEPKPRMVKPPVAKGEAPKPKMVQAPSRRGTGSSRRAASAPKKKSPLPLVLGGLAVVVIAVVAVLVLNPGGGGKKKSSDVGNGGKAKAAAATGKTPEAGDPPASAGGGNVEDDVDRAAELAEEYHRKRTLAESEKELWALATWCKENGLTTEMKAVADELIPKDSKYSAMAHRLIGHKRFQGEHPDYQDKWMSKAELAKANEAEKKYQHRLSTDPRFEKVEAAVKNAKYLYLREVPHFVVREWPYVIFIEDFGNKKDNDHYAAEKADQVRSFYAYMKKTFPGMIKSEPDIPYRVIVFKDAASYNKFNEGAHTGKGSGGKEGKSRARAHFSLRTKFVYYYEKEAKGSSFSPKTTLGVLFHECTHQLMNDLRQPEDNKASPSMWFEEAFAEYIGAVKKSGEFEKDDNGVDRMEFKVAEVNSYRLPHIQRMIKLKRIFPLTEMFMCRSYEEANQAFRIKWGRAGGFGQSLLYCQGWSFVYFCMNGGGGKYRDKMINYIKLDAAGDSFGYETMSECFGIAEDAQWEPIQREWLAYVNRLRPDGTLKKR